jgi:hypothetical protein
MANEQNSFRTTISVPSDLKARMDRVKEPVNWSALACRAFEDKLAEIAAKKETKSMNDVVERLRSSLRDQQGVSFNEGYQAGEKWAELTATAVQLKQLAEFQEIKRTKSHAEWEDWFWPKGKHQPWRILVGVIKDGKVVEVHPMNAKMFWNNVLGNESIQPNDGDYLRGFVEGAVDLWIRVQPYL